MIAKRKIECHEDHGRLYWLASGDAYGSMLLAEGSSRDEAIKAWTQMAADRQLAIFSEKFAGGVI